MDAGICDVHTRTTAVLHAFIHGVHTWAIENLITLLREGGAPLLPQGPLVPKVGRRMLPRSLALLADLAEAVYLGTRLDDEAGHIGRPS